MTNAGADLGSAAPLPVDQEASRSALGSINGAAASLGFDCPRKPKIKRLPDRRNRATED
jgi:hypothetical protein